MPTKTTERRTFVLPIEIRSKSDTDKSNKISGYAARYYDPKDPATQYQLWSDTFERLLPGAFKSAIARPDDVRCLFNHDPNNILGRTTSGTCKLTVDDKGLFFEAELPDSPVGQTVAEAIRRKDITGCSFSFDVIKCTWTEDASGANGSIWYRDITDVQLYDVGPVTFPAYEATDVDMASARSSLDQFKAQRQVPAHVREARRRWRMCQR